MTPTATLPRSRTPVAGDIGPVRREVVFEPIYDDPPAVPVHEPAPAEPTPAPSREPEPAQR